MCPYPYTISSVSDMAAVAAVLVKLEHSGILVDEVLSMMMLTLAKVWASPSVGTDSVGADAAGSKRSLGKTVEFCGSNVMRLVLFSTCLDFMSR